jgi:hypothetical protein
MYVNNAHVNVGACMQICVCACVRICICNCKHIIAGVGVCAYVNIFV